jgi:superkiller protein 3
MLYYEDIYSKLKSETGVLKMAGKNNAQRLLESGNAFYEQGKYLEAYEEYRRAIEIDPNYVFGYYNWGNVLYDLKRYDEAIEKYKKVIEINPNDVYAYYNWGNVLFDLKRYEEAIE